MNGAIDDLYEIAQQWQGALTAPAAQIVNQVWAKLDASSLPVAQLSVLDSLQILEKLLWPTYSDSQPNQHVILLAAVLNYKRQSRTLSWTQFTEAPENFSNFFHRVLSLLLDASVSAAARNALLGFIITAFQSLEQDLVRKECAPLVSIATWENLHSEAFLEKQLGKDPARRKAWKAAKKRYDTASPKQQDKMRFDRAWLYATVLDFVKRIELAATGSFQLLYYEKFVEFLIDLISQLPTRRYTIVLFKDLNLLPLLKNSSTYHDRDSPMLCDLIDLLGHFYGFVIDDTGSIQGTQQEAQYDAVAALQAVAHQTFPDKLRVLVMSNIASLLKSGELRSHLEPLSDLELEKLCQLVDIRTTYPQSTRSSEGGIVTGRQVFLMFLESAFAAPPSIKDVTSHISSMPTEKSLYDDTLLRNENFDGSSPLALPKLNLQYLTLSDFAWRSFRLYQAETFFEIRQDMENIAKKLGPKASRDGFGTHFTGFSKMAIPIDKPAMIEVAPPRVGSSVPAHVRAEVILDVSRLGDKIRAEWDALGPKDAVFLMSVQAAKSPASRLTNGKSSGMLPTAEKPFTILRTAEVVQVQDEKGRPLRRKQGSEGPQSRGRTRRLLLDLDPVAFQNDQNNLAPGKTDVYSTINVIARRSGRENNFKPVLESIQGVLSSDINLPGWLQDVYLGYGQPSSASYPTFAPETKTFDYLDTFVDWQHLTESFPNKAVKTDSAKELTPPYVLDLSQAYRSVSAPTARKRRRAEMEENDTDIPTVTVSSYKPKNTGPYPQDQIKKNTIRFTPQQTNAIISGVNPGLSLVVGPPGTGKTDVATQIINLLYHNYPEERILLVAHSNQALNQLFQKIAALDIDTRHLLRLGHGEGDLDSAESFSKHGRVEAFMENRAGLLTEVNRLAASLGIQGAHGNSCETADYFNEVHVKSAWTRFWNVASSEAANRDDIARAFPFGSYFADAPVPELFPHDAEPQQCREIAQGCQYHLNKIFFELESIRPFEVLRNSRDQANYLLTSEARIVAMTSTHAAIRRDEIVSLGFHFDTLVMEEAAQITEIESFIPISMQKHDTKTGELALKRIVLVGDHLQNSPIIQNHALRDYANFEQSLFLRLIRLGVPATMLDAQGRCRPSIASLFSWRYPNLTNLPHLLSHPEFARANAGFAHEFQFINIDDYQGTGEREPSPHFIQNLGEAEYAVALYQYMRLLNYPASSITILAAYAGQRALIRDVLEHRCKNNRLFGMPRLVTTVDKYQGEQNDYIILSLTRTKSVGFMRDVRRLTVALSRARLGLYVLGRKALFETCFEMQVAMERFGAKGNRAGNLEVTTGEMWPTKRAVEEVVEATEIVGLEHLGQYVFEMTQAKVRSLGGDVQLEMSAGAVEGAKDVNVDGVEEDVEDDEEEDGGDDPLHENV